MQYELRLRDEREAGKLEGKQEKLVENIRLLIENANFSTDQAMKILQVPEKEQGLYLRLLNDPAFYEEYFSEAEYDDEDEEKYYDHNEDDGE